MGQSVKDLFRKSGLSWHGKESPVLVTPRHVDGMRLADFIHENSKQIISEWESFARTLTPASNDMTPLALRNHIHEILAFIVRDIKSPQTSQEQIQKSQGDKEKSPNPTAAEIHAALRLAGGFDIDQMVSEWRALRASVIKLWSFAHASMNDVDIIDLTRFNESIDQELAESITHYAHKVSYSKDLFMGILGHDLRTPLNVISMSAELMLNIGALNERRTLNQRQIMLTTQIFESASRITTIVNDLLDVSRARFGYGLPVIRAPMDMGFVSRQLVNEMRAAYPKRSISLNVSGDVKGDWDKARIGQVFSNLIGNAIQYGFDDVSVSVVVWGTSEDVLLSVHNEGIPIPPEKIGAIFNALTRAVTDDKEHPPTVNLGLGLYITKEIVDCHGGTIEVSSGEEGTTFTARFPRFVKAALAA